MTPDIPASDETLTNLRNLLDAATPAPWVATENDRVMWMESPEDPLGLPVAETFWPNADLIAAARNQLPALLDRLAAAETEAAQARSNALTYLANQGNLNARLSGELESVVGTALADENRYRAELGAVRAHNAALIDELSQCIDAYGHLMDLSDQLERRRALVATAPDAPLTDAAPAVVSGMSQAAADVCGDATFGEPCAKPTTHIEAGDTWHERADQLAVAGTNSGHCGLCGSEDCPGVPGEGCTPGPFEPVNPADLVSMAAIGGGYVKNREVFAPWEDDAVAGTGEQAAPTLRARCVFCCTSNDGRSIEVRNGRFVRHLASAGGVCSGTDKKPTVPPADAAPAPTPGAVPDLAFGDRVRSVICGYGHHSTCAADYCTCECHDTTDAVRAAGTQDGGASRG